MFCAKNSPVPDDTTDLGSRWPTIVLTLRSGPVGAVGGGGKSEADDGVAAGELLAAGGEAGLDDATGGAELGGVAGLTADELAAPGGNGAAAV